MTFYVENETQEEFDFPLQEIAAKVAEETLRTENCPYEAEIELTIVDEDVIQRYNKEFRGIDKVTDVLSFPGIEFETVADFSQVEGHRADYFNPDTEELILGNMMICARRMKEQALSFGHSEKREYAFLIAHSLLHLCGYDHMTEDEALLMEKRQEEILNKLGITRE